MRNYKLKIQYEGTNYAGWQVQNNADTIQGKIIEAVKVLLKEQVNLIGSGRTDAGVHALGQIANFRTEKEIHDSDKFLYSLNSILPDDITILEIDEVSNEFHSRFDAKDRSYLYFFSFKKSPFFNKYSYHYPRVNEYQVEKLNEISKALLGEHDCTSLARKNTETENKFCVLQDVHWRKNKYMLIFSIKANRFLHGMVRTIVGTILYAAKNDLNESYILEVLNKKDREAAAEAAPAKGLFLFKVRY